MKEYLEKIPVLVKIILGITIAFILFLYIVFFQAPAHFPIDAVIKIESGETLNEITNTLYEAEIIRSPFFFKAFVILFGGSRGVQQGDYYFTTTSNLTGIAYRLTSGIFGFEPVVVLIPEGFTSYDIADRLEILLTDFDAKKFRVLSKEKEGYLFPDTYLFPPNIKPELVLDEMEANFREKTAELNVTSDIIIMASIIEREARRLETKKMISGILWSRIEIGMALQVDAVFGYIKGIATFNPTFDDLEIDSPYNTYKHPGLPPGPISNPGLNSIIAALEPISSPHLFYLTGKDGRMHYSRTFEEHLKNKRLYLR